MDQDIIRKPSPCPVNVPVVLYSPVVLQEEQEDPSATDVQDVPGNLVGKDLVGENLNGESKGGNVMKLVIRLFFVFSSLN